MHIENHELGEEMYCSQQICIPPTFPYLLRQFAKAAIRTQPNDLLKWSTAYFRCLSLNIPPPVKPRLEYPIPKDFCGVTPGWLKALLHQMPGVTHVSFKTLWDRWIGACLHHPDLIKILCLGGFDNPMAIPWLRFIGLCTAFLTESLTKTMILICEVLTEEPEGGSAMINVDVFNDLYQFLARIDASKAQMLKNYFFRDSLLGLWDRRIKEDQGPFEVPEEVEEEESAASTPEEEVPEEQRAREDGSIISCPSVDNPEQDEDLKAELERRLKETEGEEYEDDEEVHSQATLLSNEKLSGMIGTSDEDYVAAKSEDDVGRVKKDEDEDEDVDDVDEQDASVGHDDKLATDADAAAAPPPRDETEDGRMMDAEAVAEEEEEGGGGGVDPVDPVAYAEDMERLRAVQQELAGEDDYDLEKLKADLLQAEALPKTDSELTIPEHYKTKADCKKYLAQLGASTVVAEEPKFLSDEALRKAIEAKIKEGDYEEVYVEAVPGIGPIVPEHMIQAVLEYTKSVARDQFNVVMPRNIRHYECPPLEVLDY